MSDNQMAELHERLVAGKRKPTNADYPFNRGWNAGIDYAIGQAKLTCDEVVDAPDDQRPAVQQEVVNG